MADKLTGVASYNCVSRSSIKGEHWEYSKAVKVSGSSAEDIRANAEKLKTTICGNYRVSQMEVSVPAAAGSPVKSTASSGYSSALKTLWDVMERCIINHRHDCDLK